jgi:hypothetical protein
MEFEFKIRVPWYLSKSDSLTSKNPYYTEEVRNEFIDLLCKISQERDKLVESSYEKLKSKGKKPVDICYNRVIEVLNDEYYSFEDDRFHLFCPANIKKYIYENFNNEILEQYPSYSKFIDEVESKCSFRHKIEENLNLGEDIVEVNEYPILITPEFKSLISKKKEYSHFLNDLTTKLMGYHISIQKFKLFFKNESIFYDISENLSYNDVLEKTIEWLIENSIACKIEDLEEYVSSDKKDDYPIVCDELPF